MVVLAVAMEIANETRNFSDKTVGNTGKDNFNNFRDIKGNALRRTKPMPPAAPFNRKRTQQKQLNPVNRLPRSCKKIISAANLNCVEQRSTDIGKRFLDIYSS